MNEGSYDPVTMLHWLDVEQVGVRRPPGALCWEASNIRA